MRRQIIILVALFMFAATGFAGYPADYLGDPLADGCADVEAWITDWHDMNPWGQRDPTGTYFLMGTLCVDGGVAVLDFTDLAWRWCHEAPWGTPGDPPVCEAWWVGEWRTGRHVLAWDGGVYISGIWFEDDDGGPIYYFDALTYDATEKVARFVEGVFSLSSMWFEDDDRYTRTTFVVRGRETEYANKTRESSERRSAAPRPSGEKGE